jgi:DNA-directed RNA polymerase subunit F
MDTLDEIQRLHKLDDESLRKAFDGMMGMEVSDEEFDSMKARVKLLGVILEICPESREKFENVMKDYEEGT